jgi:hypothetical protein
MLLGFPGAFRLNATVPLQRDGSTRWRTIAVLSDVR